MAMWPNAYWDTLQRATQQQKAQADMASQKFYQGLADQEFGLRAEGERIRNAATQQATDQSGQTFAHEKAGWDSGGDMLKGLIDLFSGQPSSDPIRIPGFAGGSATIGGPSQPSSQIPQSDTDPTREQDPLSEMQHLGGGFGGAGGAGLGGGLGGDVGGQLGGGLGMPGLAGQQPQQAPMQSPAGGMPGGGVGSVGGIGGVGGVGGMDTSGLAPQMGDPSQQLLHAFANQPAHIQQSVLQAILTHKVQQEAAQRQYLQKLHAATQSIQAVRNSPSMTQQQKDAYEAQTWAEVGGLRGMTGSAQNTMMGQGPMDIANTRGQYGLDAAGIRAGATVDAAKIRANAPGHGRISPDVDPAVLTALRTGTPEERDAAAAQLASQGFSFHQLHEYAKGTSSADPANTPANSFQWQQQKAREANRAKIATALIGMGVKPEDLGKAVDAAEQAFGGAAGQSGPGAPPTRRPPAPAPGGSPPPSSPARPAAPISQANLDAAVAQAKSEGLTDPAQIKDRARQLLGAQ